MACNRLGIELLLSDWGMIGKTCSGEEGKTKTDIMYLTFEFYEDGKDTFNWKRHTLKRPKKNSEWVVENFPTSTVHHLWNAKFRFASGKNKLGVSW